MVKQGWVMIATLALGAGMAQAYNPYLGIVDRNAFGLKPPVMVVPEAVTAPPEVPSNIVLSGMAKLAGKKQVFLSVTKPGEKEAKYLRLGEQEREGAIEVVEIDFKNERVRIKHNGQPSVMTFATHGAKAAGAAPVPTAKAITPPLPPPPVMIQPKSK
jgi:hypothetical protein